MKRQPRSANAHANGKTPSANAKHKVAAAAAAAAAGVRITESMAGLYASDADPSKRAICTKPPGTTQLPAHLPPPPQAITPPTPTPEPAVSFVQIVNTNTDTATDTQAQVQEEEEPEPEPSEDLLGFIKMDLGLNRYYEMMGRTDYIDYTVNPGGLRKGKFLLFVEREGLQPDCIEAQLAAVCSDDHKKQQQEAQQKEKENLEATKIRENWYQRDSKVIFTLYAKNYTPKQVRPSYLTSAFLFDSDLLI